MTTPTILRGSDGREYEYTPDGLRLWTDPVLARVLAHRIGRDIVRLLRVLV